MRTEFAGWQSRWKRPLWLAALVPCAAASVFAAEATTAPAANESAAATTQAAATDDTTPIGMLRAFDALNGADPDAFRRFYYATNDDQRRMARVEARCDAEFGLLTLMVEKKWGTAAGDEITHAMGGQTVPDAEAGKLSIIGDRATLVWKDDSPPLHMIRIDGRWKIDLGANLASLNITPDQYIEGFHKMNTMVADFADAIDSGKLATLDQALVDAKRRTAELSQSND